VAVAQNPICLIDCRGKVIAASILFIAHLAALQPPRAIADDRNVYTASRPDDHPTSGCITQPRNVKATLIGNKITITWGYDAATSSNSPFYVTVERGSGGPFILQQKWNSTLTSATEDLSHPVQPAPQPGAHVIYIVSLNYYVLNPTQSAWTTEAQSSQSNQLTIPGADGLVPACALPGPRRVPLPLQVDRRTAPPAEKSPSYRNPMPILARTSWTMPILSHGCPSERSDELRTHSYPLRASNVSVTAGFRCPRLS
jgi:hypothetical protein